MFGTFVNCFRSATAFSPVGAHPVGEGAWHTPTLIFE